MWPASQHEPAGYEFDPLVKRDPLNEQICWVLQHEPLPRVIRYYKLLHVGHIHDLVTHPVLNTELLSQQLFILIGVSLHVLMTRLCWRRFLASTKA